MTVKKVEYFNDRYSGNPTDIVYVLDLECRKLEYFTKLLISKVRNIKQNTVVSKYDD